MRIEREKITLVIYWSVMNGDRSLSLQGSPCKQKIVLNRGITRAILFIEFANANNVYRALTESETRLQIKAIREVQWNLPERPPPVSDHLTTIPIGSSVSRTANSETSIHDHPCVSK